MKKSRFHLNSIRTKLIFLTIGLLAMTVSVVLFMNKAFLPSYYQHSKVSMLENSYSKANSIIKSDDDLQSGTGDLTNHSTLNLEILSVNNSTSIYVFNLTKFMDSIYYSYVYPGENVITDYQKKAIYEKTKDYVLNLEYNQSFNVPEKGREMIVTTKKYCVYKVMDERIGSYYLELFGRLDSGSFIYMNTNYQSMKESVNTFNRFIGYIGLGIMLIGIFIMIFISNYFTKPIIQLTHIAKRMSDLDFEIRYPVTSNDEIGVLGGSINTLSETLEKTISELKTANNELQKDIEQKTQIDEMRKEFLSNVSHELKTPIALIQGYAEGLHDNINDDEESRNFYCEVITDEANKMNKMVKKLLTLNQIEFGNNQISFERFDIIQVIRSSINSATLLADQKNAAISMPDYDPTYVLADEYIVEEVITNYISNAINHVSGENKIEVSLENRDKVVRISVFNTGECIPEDELDKIWIKFYKVDKARTREYGGSGIGLSIVRAILDAMNQKCGVINHEDGVEFWFELDRQN